MKSDEFSYAQLKWLNEQAVRTVHKWNAVRNRLIRNRIDPGDPVHAAVADTVAALFQVCEESSKLLEAKRPPLPNPHKPSSSTAQRALKAEQERQRILRWESGR